MSEKFTIHWSVEDGYAGGDRPQRSTVSLNHLDLSDDMDDAAIECLYHELIDEAFQERISAYGKNLDEFKEWVKDAISKIGEA